MLIALVIGGGLYYHSRQNKPLTDKDTILVADFDNKTGDAVFDDTLKTALTVALNQSPFLNVLSDRRVGETLKLGREAEGSGDRGKSSEPLVSAGDAIVENPAFGEGQKIVVEPGERARSI